MSDWYSSSAAYAAITTYTISTAYTVGQIVKPTAPAAKARWTFRVTTAGTSAASEPTWPTTNNATVTSGGAVFTNVTGQSTYGWTAAAGDVATLLGAVGTNRFVAADRMFVSSDHSETQSSTTIYGSNGIAGFASAQVISVNRAGSVPPVAADLTAGATITVSSGTLIIDAPFPVYHYGINYVYTGTTTNAILINFNGTKAHYFDACQLYLNTSTTSCRILNNSPASITLHNSTLRFGDTAQGIIFTNYVLDFTWLNTPSAIAGATIPATLFLAAGLTTGFLVLTARGVDLSAITGTLTMAGTAGNKLLLDSCRIASGVTRYNVSGAGTTRDLMELINCYDGTNIINESYQPAGVVTTERTITLSGGATDDVGTFSHKLVSNTNIDKYVHRLLGFWMDIEQQAIGSSKTATVEINSLGSINNDEISLLLEYQGTTGSPVASIATTLPATVLTAASAVTTSTATWNSSPSTVVALWNSADRVNVTLSGGSLIATGTAGGIVRCTMGPSTGKYYWEATLGTTFANGSTGLGIASLAATSSIGATATQGGLLYPNGQIWINGGYSGSTLGARASGNVIGFALDAGAQLIWLRLAPSGNWNGSGTADPASGTGGISVAALGSLGLFPCFGPGAAGESVTANFGASGFTGTVPSGFASGIPSITAATQKLVVTFTPQLAGRVRGQVRLGKPSATVYVNPVITIT